MKRLSLLLTALCALLGPLPVLAQTLGPTPVPWRSRLPTAKHPSFKPLAKLGGKQKAAVASASAALKKAAALSAQLQTNIPAQLKALQVEEAKRQAGVDVLVGVP